MTHDEGQHTKILHIFVAEELEEDRNGPAIGRTTGKMGLVDNNAIRSRSRHERKPVRQLRHEGVKVKREIAEEVSQHANNQSQMPIQCFFVSLLAAQRDIKNRKTLQARLTQRTTQTYHANTKDYNQSYITPQIPEPPSSLLQCLR